MNETTDLQTDLNAARANLAIAQASLSAAMAGHDKELWRAYAEGRSDEKEHWQAIVNKLRTDLAEVRGML